MRWGVHTDKHKITSEVEIVREITNDPYCKGWLEVRRLDGKLFNGLITGLVPKDEIEEICNDA